jgi:enediyne biosynthesis protein E5
MKLDPRIAQIIILSIFSWVGLNFLEFRVTTIQIIVAILTSVLLEVLFTYILTKKIIAPLSAIITGLSIGLLLRSDSIIPFLLAAIIAITAKHFFKYKGNHIFNPSNIGIVIISFAFPITVATAPLQWGFLWALLFIIATAGTYMVYKVKRFSTIVSFLSVFFLAGIVRMVIWDKTFTAIFNELMWGGLLIFTFFMITDPKTSPKSVKGQILFGVLIAILGQVMIQIQIHGALFVSLFIICLARILLKIWQERIRVKKGEHLVT